MKQVVFLRKRSMTSLTFSALLIASLFIGISAVPIANLMQNAFTPTAPFPVEQYKPLFEGANEPTDPSVDKLANFDANLHDYLRTGVAPEYLFQFNNRIGILMGAGYSVDLDAVSRHMDIRHVLDMGIGLLIIGDISSPKSLHTLNNLDYTGVIMGDELMSLPSEGGPSSPVTDQFFVNEIIEADLAHTYGATGAGTVISITDTGVDFTVSDLADAYHTNSSGYPTALDPGGIGLAITDWTGSPVSGYLLTANYDFTMWFSIYPSSANFVHSNSSYGVVSDNLWIGVGLNQIPSQSGNYKVGMAVMANGAGPRTRAFYVFMLTDENTAGVYDTLYIDWETSYAISADYNGWATPPLPADWDFTNNIINGKYDYDPGTVDAPFLMAYDADGDTFNDYGLGLLANTYDYWGVVIPSYGMVSGINPDGLGFAYHFDSQGHGTSCAGTAVGRGIQPFDVYDNGTDYYLMGVAPDAKLMSTTLFSFSSEFICWVWAAGYRPVTVWGVEEDWDSWTHSTMLGGGWDDTNQAHIVHNSWGYPYRTLGDYDMIIGCDLSSFAIDFLSTGGLGFPYYNATGGYYNNPNFPDGSIVDAPLFIISAGNEGTGYGTTSNPSGPAVLTVGASSSSHYAQDVYNEDGSLGPQGYDQMAFYTSAGPTPTGLAKPDVCAPGFGGFEIMPLWRGHASGTPPFRRFGGTSMASPVVCGVAALVFEVLGYDGDYPLSEGYGFEGGLVRTIIKSTAEDIGHPAFRQGAGRVNAYKAVMMADDQAAAGGDDLLQLWCNYTFAHYALAYETNTTAAEIWKVDLAAAMDLEGQEPYWDPYGFGAAYGWVMFAGWDSTVVGSGAGYFHPGAEGLFAPNVTMMDAGFSVNGLYAGDSQDVGFIAATGDWSSLSPGDVDACWYELAAEETHSFFSQSAATTYPLFGSYSGVDNFGTTFMNQFLAADYAEIILTIPFAEFSTTYDHTSANYYPGDVNYVFLFDWNDTNMNGVVDYAEDSPPGEIRRIDTDQSGSNLLKMCVGNPGAQWYGNKNATIYYRDRGIEEFLYRQLEVEVTIRLYNKVDWDWFTFTQGSDPYMWTATIDVPVDATPGMYAGFVNMSLGNNVEYFPVSVNVAGDVTPGTTLTWGDTDGHPYDNGAIGGTRWDLDGQRTSGDWRHYYVDVADPDETTWVMVNVTWQDPDTILDVWLDLGHFGSATYLTALGVGASHTNTLYEDYGRWDSTPSWDRQNVVVTDYFLMSYGLRFTSDVARDNSPQPPIIISVHCVQRGGMYPVENITISVSATTYVLDPYTPWFGPDVPPATGYLNETSAMDPVIDDSEFSGEHITFNATFEPWGFAHLPVPYFQTDLQVLLGATYDVSAVFTAANATPGNPPPNDYEFTISDISTGMLITVDFSAGPPVGGTSLGPHDCDIFLYYEGVEVASSTNSGSDETIEYTAAFAGTYTLVVDYWGIDDPPYYVWGGWDTLPFHFTLKASQIISNPTPGRTSLYDTHALGLNLAGFDVTAKMVTGTTLDESALLSFTVYNISVTNFFEPTLTLVSPTTGAEVGPDPFFFNWTASDQNSDETLGFSVEVSNDNGLNWTLIVPGTLEFGALWDPNGFYGLNATNQMRFRVNCTDGMYTVSETSGIFTVLPLVPPPPPPPYELIVVIAVIVIVIIILLMTCILKRRQVAKT